MRQHASQEDPPASIVDFGEQPVCISLDVEHGVAADRIRCREHAPRIHQILPLRFLRDPIPDIQRLAEAGMSLCRFKQLLATDHVHSVH
jgi:hypothetical protein